MTARARMSSCLISQPTFRGYVATTLDALILFEACLQGYLSSILRRPHGQERYQLIRSGYVFIYEENTSRIKRWTDGVTWSLSEILGNFLIYRELDKPFPPGENNQYTRPEGSGNEGIHSSTTPQSPSIGAENLASEMKRKLIGTPVDSYRFKVNGLVKKTMSVTLLGVTYHLVSYYNDNDALTNQLQTPSTTDNLHYIRQRLELTSNQSFRSLLEADEYENQPWQTGYGHSMPWQQQQHPHYLPQHAAPSYPQSHGGYLCESCGRFFSKPSSLRTHENSHTGAQPFPCQHPGCNKRFSVRSNWKRHERLSHRTPNKENGSNAQNGSDGGKISGLKFES